jgi:hypothetical protein
VAPGGLARLRQWQLRGQLQRGRGHQFARSDPVEGLAELDLALIGSGRGAEERPDDRRPESRQVSDHRGQHSSPMSE